MDEYAWGYRNGAAEVSQYASEAERLKVRVKALEDALRSILSVYEIEPVAQQIARKALEEKK